MRPLRRPRPSSHGRETRTLRLARLRVRHLAIVASLLLLSTAFFFYPILNTITTAARLQLPGRWCASTPTRATPRCRRSNFVFVLAGGCMGILAAVLFVIFVVHSLTTALQLAEEQKAALHLQKEIERRKALRDD